MFHQGRPSPAPSKVLSVPIDKILLGGESDIRAREYAYLTGDIKRPSTPARLGPHASFLRAYVNHGDEIFEKELFESTEYFKNARDCIRVSGDYFPEIVAPDQIILSARRFVLLFERKDVSHLPSAGRSKDGELIKLFPIRDSDCYELHQGNHRLAFAAQRGDQYILAEVEDQPRHTPLQEMVLRVAWDTGAKELYQPLDLPELEHSWHLIRNCRDRLQRMLDFLARNDLKPDSVDGILDIGSYYGWFVSQFISRGYRSFGVERDRQAIRVGEIVHGNLNNQIIWDDASTLLLQEERAYDVISCLSVMHHYILSKYRVTAEEFLARLARRTRRVLFFDMGEEHETWFASSLSGWSHERIKQWILDNTDFRCAYELGRDRDGDGPHKGNYGRMLFAFVK
jgi:2-polyprenyl-3-methyl-5-hydroxy-6-metoxy-1,4-benzoquinol methylase